MPGSHNMKWMHSKVVTIDVQVKEVQQQLRERQILLITKNDNLISDKRNTSDALLLPSSKNKRF